MDRQSGLSSRPRIVVLTMGSTSLCKSKNKVVAEYALRNTKGPIGVAEYQLVEALPKDLEANLPSVEQIERELGEVKESGV